MSGLELYFASSIGLHIQRNRRGQTRLFNCPVIWTKIQTGCSISKHLLLLVEQYIMWLDKILEC